MKIVKVGILHTKEGVMTKKKLWLISEVFYPDVEIATGNIATEIAYKFSSTYEVHVICGPAGYEKGTKISSSSLNSDIIIHRVDHFDFDKNHKLKRLMRVIGISLSMFYIGLKIQKKDKVFLISNPAFIIPFFALLKILKGFKYSLLMHDVFPENLVVGGYLRQRSVIYKGLEAIFIKSRATAEKIVVLGRDMKDLIVSKLPVKSKTEVIIIPNWADVTSVYPKRQRRFEQDMRKVIFQFAGNHGVLQGLDRLLKIISMVSNPNVHFVFAGSGAMKDKLVDYAKIKKIENITFLDAFPRNELNGYLNSCDVGIVSLSEKLFGVGVPSKSYNIFAAGRPILFLGNLKSEIALFVSENKVGWAFDYSDEDGILNFFNEVGLQDLAKYKHLGEKGREIVLREYNKELILQKIFQSV